MKLFQDIDVYSLQSGFMSLNYKLQDLLDPNENPYYFQDAQGELKIPLSTFADCMSTLERLEFIETNTEWNTYNGFFSKRPSAREARIKDYKERNFKTGFIYTMDYSTHFQEPEGAKHLPMAETEFKDAPTQFLQIYTIGNRMEIYTNKDLPFEKILKLKILQRKLFKDVKETPLDIIDDFLFALSESDLKKINDITEQILELPAVKERKLKQLDEIFSKDYKSILSNLKYNLENYEQSYIRKTNELSRLVDNIQNAQEEYEVMEERSKQKQDNSALLKYLSKHPYLKEIEKVSRNSVSLYYESPLIYFDEFVARKLIKKTTDPHKKAILKAILDRKYELMSRCQIYFNTQTFEVDLQRIGADEFIGHPHIDQYHCFGNHDTYIYDCKRTNNFLQAIEQITAATLNVNFKDAIVVSKMLTNVAHYYDLLKTWRNVETGEFVSTQTIFKEYMENEEA